MIVIADTSPLTALLHLEKLDLLKELYGQIFIPSSVAEELKSLIDFSYNISFLEDKTCFKIRSAIDFFFVEQLCRYLDKGEAEAIALAKELNAGLLLIDEKTGKQFAEAEFIKCKGVVGVLIEAKLKGLLPEIKPLLDNLISQLKFRLSDNIYRIALQRTSEMP